MGCGIGGGRGTGELPTGGARQCEEGGRWRSGLLVWRRDGWGCGTHRHERLDREWVDAGEVEDRQSGRVDGCVCIEHWCSGPRSLSHDTAREEERKSIRGGMNGQKATDHQMAGFLRWAGGAAEWTSFWQNIAEALRRERRLGSLRHIGLDEGVRHEY